MPIQSKIPIRNAKPDNVQSQVEELNALREKAEELAREKSRITGELNTVKKRLDELRKKCQAEYECGVEELPSLIQSLEQEAIEGKNKAKSLLGIE